MIYCFLDHSIDPNSFSSFLQISRDPITLCLYYYILPTSQTQRKQRGRVEVMETLFPSQLVSNSSGLGGSTWTVEENKMFESALAMFEEEAPDRWFKVAAMIPGKSVYDVINQYRELVADVSDIEAGLVPIPGYLSATFTFELHRGFDVCRKRVRVLDQERKKGVPWTEDEHRRFLMGLEKHGKGDWKNISRNFVVSKTPTQVASHAQKYYLRQLAGGKDKRRPSIHDLTIHLTGTNATTPCFLQKSDQPENTAEILLNWNDNHHGDLMGFDSSFGASFSAYPCNMV